METILFLIQSSTNTSSRVRVLNLIDRLEAKGYVVACMAYPKRAPDKVALFKMLADYDVVYLQKKLPSLIDAHILKRLSNRLVFDFDDAVFMRHESHKKQTSRLRTLRFRNIVRKAHTVVAGNRILADIAHADNENVAIVPSVVDVDDVPVRNYSVENDKFVVGWVGTTINLTQFSLLADVFKKLAADIPLEIRVISGRVPDIEGVDLKFIPWDPVSQEREIAKFDVGIMPLPDNPHAMGKCGYKALQYMAAGVVPVVSDVGINPEIVRGLGWVAKNIGDFYDKLKFLFENPGVMKKAGPQLIDRVRRYYSVDFAVNQLDELFLSL